MFLGRFKTYFSGKNRLILPRKFRRELGSDEIFYIYLGNNGEIWGFDKQNWLKQAESILNIPLSTEDGRKKRLNFFSRAEECALDNQGRFILPSEFVQRVSSFDTEKSGFNEEVLIIGAGDHFEIWNPDLLEKFLTQKKDEFDL